MIIRIAGLVSMLAVTFATADVAVAADRNVDIVNNTKKTIRAFYASRANRNSWEENIIKGDPIKAGETQPIDIDDGSGGCRYDFKAVFSDGEERISNNVDVCSVSKWTYR